MSMLKARIAKDLAAIGNDAPPSQDALDGAIYDYYVASTLSSMIDKRKEVAKKALLSTLAESATAELEAVKQSVAASELSDDVDLGAGQHFSVSAQVKIGASYLDVDSLRVELKKTMPTDKVDALFARHTKRRAPSVTLKPLVLGDD